MQARLGLEAEPGSSRAGSHPADPTTELPPQKAEPLKEARGWLPRACRLPPVLHRRRASWALQGCWLERPAAAGHEGQGGEPRASPLWPPWQPKEPRHVGRTRGCPPRPPGGRSEHPRSALDQGPSDCPQPEAPYLHRAPAAGERLAGSQAVGTDRPAYREGAVCGQAARGKRAAHCCTPHAAGLSRDRSPHRPSVRPLPRAAAEYNHPPITSQDWAHTHQKVLAVAVAKAVAVAAASLKQLLHVHALHDAVRA